MVPSQAPNHSAHITDAPPPLTRSSTLPTYPQKPIATHRSLLTPEDAIHLGSPPRKQSPGVNTLHKSLRMTNAEEGAAQLSKRGRHKSRNRSGSRMRAGRTWKKLLWIKQSYLDNYTDQATFLEHLQRNPRLQPYDFWPLVADSTVIVQHVCSVIIFGVCFVGIYQERIAPEAVVGWASVFTILGWLLWDWWVGQEDEQASSTPPIYTTSPHEDSASSSTTNLLAYNGNGSGNGIGNINGNGSANAFGRHSHSASASSIHSSYSPTHSVRAANGHDTPPNLPYPSSSPPFSHRTSLRISTAKSALLIYFTLLGLSPILKSLTRSTSSDSIWAMSFCLFVINIFFFDYGSSGGGVGMAALGKGSGGLVAGRSQNIPASLSTNAALMASTVLASRLPSTGQVFSLTLFSIEVFGLFPVFRRYCRQMTWRGHVTLTTLLVLGAGGGVGLILGRGGDGEGIWDFPYKSGLMGLVIGVVITGLAMGGCSWWLIGLQKYKNEIHGPWDPARPVIRMHWEDY